MKMADTLPQAVQNVLWSYDLAQIDLHLHKKIIISQVLNFGTKAATDWLFTTYDRNEICSVANQIPTGQWDRKSLALWSLYLDIQPTCKYERVMHAS